MRPSADVTFALSLRVSSGEPSTVHEIVQLEAHGRVRLYFARWRDVDVWIARRGNWLQKTPRNPVKPVALGELGLRDCGTEVKKLEEKQNIRV